MSQPATTVSFPNYDFPTIVNNCRSISLICIISQLVFIYTESGSLPFLTFLFYSALVGMLALHLTRRWYYSIDGRYDIRQMLREHTEMTVRIQYAVAIFSPVVLAFTCWTFVELNNGLVHSMFHITVAIQATCAFVQLGFEFYEVVPSFFRK